MRLLIITQTVDTEHPLLGFFHKWIAAFANSCESVTVIAQSIGVHHLPENVALVSLGKEQGNSTFKQVILFYREIFVRRKQYDAVFVHMTPIWMILGGGMWFLMRKRRYLWYEIKRGGVKLSLALIFVHKVFAATKHGLPFASAKLHVVGHGIDTDTFAPMPFQQDAYRIVAVGRLTTVKCYDVLLRTFAALPKKYTFSIAGGTVTEDDKEEEQHIHRLIQELQIADHVSIGWVHPDAIPTMLQQASLFLHASRGGLDKALLQAMSCGCPVVSSSEAAQDELPEACRSTDKSMADAAKKILAFSSFDRQSLAEQLRNHVVEHHSLTQCIQRLTSAMHQ